MMKLYNTLSRQVETFNPITPGHVKIYTCGLTVYSQPHIGNWSGYVYWDVLVAILKHLGYAVERTQNYTDVGHLTSDDDDGEDKMEKGARREGITAWDVAAKYITIADKEAYELLQLTHPDHLVRATDYIPQQIDFVAGLEKLGYTYVIDGEGVYFDTARLSDYGKLARLDVEGLEAGARVSVDGKRNITDFALWKFSPVDARRDMEWESPWGVGFPGWHLECSVIARETLGDQIDIHTGGIDHIPVHHTNEIAQTEALTGKPFSTFWVHNNHMKVDGTKISKSLGNIYTLEDITAKGFSLDAFKLTMYSKHYRTEGNFTWDILEAAQNRLDNWKQLTDLRWQTLPTNSHTDAPNTKDVESLAEDFVDAIADDLNTPQALNIVDQFMNHIAQTGLSQNILPSFTRLIELVDELLGISLLRDDISDQQKQLVRDREAARANKDWATSDDVRDTLLGQGVGVRDTTTGSQWYWL